VARAAGAEVRFESELMPELGPALGKGDAIWRALTVADGDIVVYMDSDTTDFGAHYLHGMIGPLLTDPAVRFVKGCYTRPLSAGETLQPDAGSRVTELTAKPLLNIFYPELTGFAQPLAGEIAASRELLTSIPFLTGYAVEIAMLIDAFAAVGIDAMAQVDLGTRTNPNQSLFALGKMAYAVARAVELRLRRDGRLQGEAEPESEYVQALRAVDGLRLERSTVDVVERPPMRDVLARRPGG
jgi:glucosyl-3-phosphoglycerate synthase